MREIVDHEYENESKCPMCNFRHTSLYRFDDENESNAVCGSCFATHAVTSGLTVPEEDEVIVNKIVSELVEHALAELSAGELDELENTLRSIENQLPDGTAHST